MISELGAKREQYNLVNWAGVFLGVLLIGVALAGIVLPRLAARSAPGLEFSDVLLGIVILGGAFLFARSTTQASLTVFDHGFELAGLRGKRTVQWKDIEDVVMDFRVRKPFKFEGWMVIFFFMSWLVFVVFVLADLILVRSSTRFELWLAGAEILTIRGDVVAARFQGALDKALVEHHAAATLDAVKSGEKIDLSGHVTYSLEGIQGTRIKRGSHARREEPFSIPWSDYVSTQIQDGWLEIRGAHKTLLSILLSDAINVAVFRTVAQQVAREARKGRAHNEA